MGKHYIDFHTHILPGCDHGCRDVDESLKQLGMLSDAGISNVVATSHFYPQSMSVREFISERNASARELVKALDDMKGDRPDVKITLGAEVLVCEQLESMDGLEMLAVDGTDTILLELPFVGRTPGICDTVESISRHFNVVLAHIDRYPLNEILSLLECERVYAQFNASAFTSLFKNPDYMCLIDCDKAVALGTDIHRTDEKCVRRFKKAIRRIGEPRVERIMSHAYDILYNAKYIN